MPNVSTEPFDGNPARYSDEEWDKACILDANKSEALAKRRYALPVREPDGTLNVNALRKAADELRSADAHELAKDDARERLQKRFVKAGLAVTVEVAKATLSAADRKSLPSSAFVFPDTKEYPIHDESHARNALSRGAQNESGSRLAKIRAAVKAKFPNIGAATKSEIERVVPVWKDDSKQVVYGVVLTPGLVDSQGDISSAEDIEKAAHAFLAEYRKHDVQHAEVTTTAGGEPIAKTVESFIAPQDMEIAGETVLKGSWVLATHVSDPATWERVVKGEITGYSIGGTGERVPLAA